MAKKLTVADAAKKLKLEVVAGKEGLSREIEKPTMSRPGLELAGLFDFYESNRIQLFGSKEVTFYYWLNEEDRKIRTEMLFREDTPAFIFSNNFTVPECFIHNAEKYKIPILRCGKKTMEIFVELYDFLSEELAPMISMHGVLMDLNGIGVVIKGKSSIGKSEVAMELIKRGHQLVADDVIDIYEKAPGTLIGRAPKVLEKFLEIRGIGIINAVEIFGAGAFREKKRIDLIVQLEDWNEKKEYDRIGLNKEFEKILSTKIPKIRIPVKPGRNVSSLVEVAAMNQRLHDMGYDSAQDFLNGIDNILN